MLLSRKGGVKVVRSKSDRGLRSTNKDQSKETDNQALISAIISLSTTIFDNYSLSLLLFVCKTSTTKHLCDKVATILGSST